MTYSATDQRRVARLTIDDLYQAEQDARDTAQQISDEIARLHCDGLGNDPRCDKLLADHRVAMAQVARLERQIGSAENAMDGGQWR